MGRQAPLEVILMNTIEKAKQLYIDCDNCNPNENTLMAFYVPWFEERDIYQTLAVSLMINKLACKTDDNDWLSKREILWCKNIGDRKEINKVLYRLTKKGILDVKEIENTKYYRLLDTVEGLFDYSYYKRPQMA
jgi:hypothetical protein